MNWFRNLPIRNKILSYMLVFTTLPIILVTAIALSISYHNAKDQLIYYHRMSSGWLQDSLNLEMQDTMKQIYSFEADKSVRNVILSWCGANQNLTYSQRWDLISAMNSMISMESSINSIDLYNYSQEQVLVAERSGATLEDTGSKLGFWLDHPKDLQNNLVYFRMDDEILQVHELHRFEDNQPIGLLVIHIRPYALQRTLSDIKTIPEESIFILNDQDELIESDLGEDAPAVTAKLGKIKDLLISKEQKEIYFENQFWFYKPINNGKLQLIVSVPEKTISKSLYPMIATAVLIAILMAIADILCSVWYSSLISKPIQKLSHEMQNLKLDNYQLKHSSDRSDEIGVLQESFDSMILRNKELIEQEYQSQIEKRSAQLKALQAQINPHFMYNTLQVIGGMSLQHNAPEIYRITVALCDIMRYSLNFSKETVALKEEISYLESYIMIQNERFGGHIRLNLNVPEETLSCMVPKLILQPLAENSFEYGFSNQTSDCVLSIESSFINDQDLEIKVMDNGVGFVPERLAEIQGSLNRDMNSSLNLKSHIGLSNVHNRIRLHSGSDKYGLTIESRQYQGTVITILLKKVIE
ncbi:MAG: sensor histidine kinase [Pseudobutyrivibrio sp.]|nr:sensor histidine kinase [Pseudobutyrivibrio sp.]